MNADISFDMRSLDLIHDAISSNNNNSYNNNSYNNNRYNNKSY